MTGALEKNGVAPGNVCSPVLGQGAPVSVGKPFPVVGPQSSLLEPALDVAAPVVGSKPFVKSDPTPSASGADAKENIKVSGEGMAAEIKPAVVAREGGGSKEDEEGQAVDVVPLSRVAMMRQKFERNKSAANKNTPKHAPPVPAAKEDEASARTPAPLSATSIGSDAVPTASIDASVPATSESTCLADTVEGATDCDVIPVSTGVVGVVQDEEPIAPMEFSAVETPEEEVVPEFVTVSGEIPCSGLGEEKSNLVTGEKLLTRDESLPEIAIGGAAVVVNDGELLADVTTSDEEVEDGGAEGDVTPATTETGEPGDALKSDLGPLPESTENLPALAAIDTVTAADEAGPIAAMMSDVAGAVSDAMEKLADQLSPDDAEMAKVGVAAGGEDTQFGVLVGEENASEATKTNVAGVAVDTTELVEDEGKLPVVAGSQAVPTEDSEMGKVDQGAAVVEEDSIEDMVEVSIIEILSMKGV